MIKFDIMMQCFMISIWLYGVSLWLSDAAHNITSFSSVLVAMCVYVVFSKQFQAIIMYAFLICRHLGNLLMHTCGYSEHQEHQLEDKEEIHYIYDCCLY